MEILASFSPTTKYRIVGGNTGTGVFKHDEESYDAFVDINHVVELKQQSQELKELREDMAKLKAGGGCCQLS